MSTTETSTFAPAGTWRLDPVHSTVGFEIAYLAGTFKGEFREAQSTLEIADDGATPAPARPRSRASTSRTRTSPRTSSRPTSSTPSGTPSCASPPSGSPSTATRSASTGRSRSRASTKPVTVTGTASPALSDPYGNERVGFALGATVDRTDFGIDWNMPLPTGGPALADDVTIVAELQFVKAD